MPTHITAARDALLTDIYSTGKTDFLSGKQIFLQGNQHWKKRRNRARATFRNRCPLACPRIFKESNAELGNKLHRRLKKRSTQSWKKHTRENDVDWRNSLMGSDVLKNQTHYRQSCRRSVSRSLLFMGV